MPKIICKCGESVSYSTIPCQFEYRFISDVDYDKYTGFIDAEELYKEMKSFLKCSKCNRLWIFWEGYSKDPIEYVPGENSKL